MSLIDLLIMRRYDKIRKPSQLISFLYHPDELIRFRAAEALGYLCRGERAKNYILRLFWHLSDESGAYCIGAPLGIAEIGKTNPDVFETFKNKFVSLLDDWEVERKYVAYGVGRTAEVIKDAYPDPVEKLKEKMEKIKNLEFTAYALWALMKLGEDVSSEKFSGFDEVINFYNGEVVLKGRFQDIISIILKSK